MMSSLLDLDTPTTLNNISSHVQASQKPNSLNSAGGGDGADLGGRLLFFSQQMRLKPIVTVTTSGRCHGSEGSGTRGTQNSSMQQQTSGDDSTKGPPHIHHVDSSFQHHSQQQQHPSLLHPITHYPHINTSRRPHYIDAINVAIGGPTSHHQQQRLRPPPAPPTSPPAYLLNENIYLEDHLTNTNTTLIGTPSAFTSESPERSSTNAMIVKSGSGREEVSSSSSTATTASAPDTVFGGWTSTASWPSVQIQKAPQRETRSITTPVTEGGRVLYSKGVATTTATIPPLNRHHSSMPTNGFVNHQNTQQQQRSPRGHQAAAGSPSFKPIPPLDSADTAFASTSTTTSKSTTNSSNKQQTTPDGISPGSGFSMHSHTPHIMGHRTSETSSVTNSNPRTFSSSSKLFSNRCGDRFGSGGDGRKSKGNNKDPNKSSGAVGPCHLRSTVAGGVSNHRYNHQRQQGRSFSRDSGRWVLEKSVDHDDVQQHGQQQQPHLLPPTHTTPALAPTIPTTCGTDTSTN